MERNQHYIISILSDTSRLQELYDLRVHAWQNSKSSNIINHQKYPEGFTDELDNKSIHLIATDIRGTNIMSACRLTFFADADKYPYIGIKNLPASNFALIGRGVRSSSFGHKKLQYDFVRLALDICRKYDIAYATGHAYNENVYMQQLMLDLDFSFLCNVDKENYRNPDLAFPGKLFIADLTNNSKEHITQTYAPSESNH